MNRQSYISEVMAAFVWQITYIIHTDNIRELNVKWNRTINAHL